MVIPWTIFVNPAILNVKNALIQLNLIVLLALPLPISYLEIIVMQLVP